MRFPFFKALNVFHAPNLWPPSLLAPPCGQTKQLLLDKNPMKKLNGRLYRPTGSGNVTLGLVPWDFQPKLYLNHGARGSLGTSCDCPQVRNTAQGFHVTREPIILAPPI